MGTIGAMFLLQLVGKLIIPQIRHRFFGPNPEVVKYREAEIDMATLLAAYNRQLVKVKNHNDSIYHDFHINVNETTSTITIVSSILTNSHQQQQQEQHTNESESAVPRYSLQVTTLKIRMANLSNADLTLSTQFITNLVNATNSNTFADRHNEFLEL